MADEFVQVVKFKVDDSELVAAIERMRKAFGDGVGSMGKNPTDGLEKGLKKAGKEAQKTAKEAKNISKATKEAVKETNGLASAFERMRGAVSGLVAAYAGFKGVQALVGFGRGSIEAFSAQRRAELQLDTVLRNRGMSSASGYIKNAASELQRRTTIGDESMIAGAAELATYVKDPRQLKRMMALLADYSMGMTGGASLTPEALTNLATGLGKAFDGTYDAMRKKGFDTSELETISNALKLQEDLEKGNIARDKKTGELKLSNDDKELLKWLRENRGKNIEDLKITALENALKDWKGLADEFAGTDEGKIQQLKNTIGDMREEIGRELLPVVGELAQGMKENLPVLKNLFEGFRDILLSLMKTLKAHMGEIKVFVHAMSDTIKLFAQAPVEILALAGALKVFGNAALTAKMNSIEGAAAINVFGKAMSGMLKAGLFTAVIMSLEKIYEAAKLLIELLGLENKRIDREHISANINEEDRKRRSAIDFQNALGLSYEELQQAKEAASKVPDGVDLNNVRDPSVGRYFSGLNEKQVQWMKYEFDRKSAVSRMKNLGKELNSTYSTPSYKGLDLDAEMKKELSAAKGGTTINNINYTNNIEVNSDELAKQVKENLRTLLTSQLTFVSRSETARAMAL